MSNCAHTTDPAQATQLTDIVTRTVSTQQLYDTLTNEQALNDRIHQAIFQIATADTPVMTTPTPAEDMDIDAPTPTEAHTHPTGAADAATPPAAGTTQTDAGANTDPEHVQREATPTGGVLNSLASNALAPVASSSLAAAA